MSHPFLSMERLFPYAWSLMTLEKVLCSQTNETVSASLGLLAMLKGAVRVWSRADRLCQPPSNGLRAAAPFSRPVNLDARWDCRTERGRRRG